MAMMNALRDSERSSRYASPHTNPPVRPNWDKFTTQWKGGNANADARDLLLLLILVQSFAFRPRPDRIPLPPHGAQGFAGDRD